MKKFFELSILERKSVKGNTVLTAETLSANDEVLGKLEVCVNNEDSKAGAYAKYIPNGDENTAIVSIRLIAEDQEVLRVVKEELMNSAMKDSKNMFFYMLLSRAIDVEAGKINLSIVPIPVTNSLISMVLKTEWLGVEVKYDPQIQEAIGKLEEVLEEVKDASQAKETTLREDLDNFLKS